MGGGRKLGVALGAVAALMRASAQASGPSETSPWYIDQYGGDRADLVSLYNGRLGVVMANTPRPLLFIDWRLLHGKKVGQAAGEALSVPCCGAGESPFFASDGWLEARGKIPGLPPVERIETALQTGDYMETVNCYAEALQLAKDTLTDRAQRYGAASPEVRAWIDAQDAVFATCSDQKAVMPPARAGAPAWLQFDRAYQEAAQSLYAGRYGEASDRFAAIARQSGSPWADKGLYLSARALVRQAVADKTQASAARADAALDRLAKAPAGTFGQGEARRLRNRVAYFTRPDAYLADLSRRLDRPELDDDVAIDFRDLTTLGPTRPTPPDAVDWMRTLKAQLPYPGAKPDETEEAEPARRRALDHAKVRWSASRDPAWLIAAMSLANPREADAAALVRDAGQVKEGTPAWLSVQYHLLRLTLAEAPAGESRRKLDALLARTDLSANDRNLFRAQRTQVAADLADFMRFAQRTRICDDSISNPDDKSVRCVREQWGFFAQATSVFDGEYEKGTTGFGEDARALIDRAPLATRLAISADPKLPRTLRLDVALTSYGRAVGAQDNARIDEAARQLVSLLPLMAAEFRAVLAAKPGPDKRFAEFLVLAKIPGLRPDMGWRYTRPEGKRVSDFQDHWADWILAPSATTPPPVLPSYQTDGYGTTVGYGDEKPTPDELTDLTCLGDCQRGSAPLRTPEFLASQTAAATAERRGFTVMEERYDDVAATYPAGSVAVWDEMLTYAAAHRADPRVPETLYWLVHVGRFGGSHNHSGKRAFQLLKARYPQSDWAKRTPYYYD